MVMGYNQSMANSKYKTVDDDLFRPSGNLSQELAHSEPTNSCAAFLARES